MRWWDGLTTQSRLLASHLPGSTTDIEDVEVVDVEVDIEVDIEVGAMDGTPELAAPSGTIGIDPACRAYPC